MMMTLATSPQIHKVLTAFVFGVLFVASQGFKVAQFDYKAKGPSTWWFFHAEQCDDLLFPLQSPIALNSTLNQFDVLVNAELEFSNGEVAPQSLELFNDGTTLLMRPNYPEGKRPILKGGPLIPFREYQLDHMIWHWGENDFSGGEHVIDGVSAPMELQLVFTNLIYPDFDEAGQSEDGLVLLAVQFEIDDSMKNENLHLYDKVLRSLRKSGNRIQIEASGLPSLRDLTNVVDFGEYFAYHGSLTRPPCFNTVQWIVLKNKVKIHPSQVSSFRALEGFDGQPMTRNWRPIQHENHRTIVFKGPVV